MSEDVYPWDGSDTTLVLAYGCEILTLYPVGTARQAFQDAYDEAVARDKAAAADLLASVSG